MSDVKVDNKKGKTTITNNDFIPCDDYKKLSDSTHLVKNIDGELGIAFVDLDDNQLYVDHDEPVIAEKLVSYVDISHLV